MNTKHTPGPWRMFNRADSDWTMDDVMTAAEPHRRICNVHGSTQYAENKANAILIAAAPQMLEALQLFIELHEADHEVIKGSEVQSMYDDAIKAAKAAVEEAT